jgi:hypothetical protein
MTLTIIGTRNAFTVLGCDCGGSFIVQEGKPPSFCAYCGKSALRNLDGA